MIDFHSHLGTSSSIYCTDIPLIDDNNALVNSIGLLPSKYSDSKFDKLLELINQRSDLQLGEVGLDKRFTDIISLDKQIFVLKTILDKAKDRSITLHCVRAHGAMLDILSKYSFKPGTIIWHGFNSSLEVASRLYKLGVTISINLRYKSSIKNLYNANANLVVETDYTKTDRTEYNQLLTLIYDRFSKELSWSKERTMMHMDNQFKRFTSIRNKEYLEQ